MSDYTGMTPEQMKALVAPICIAAVREREGAGRQIFPYVSGGIVREHLNLIFGHDGWSLTILEQKFVQPAGEMSSIVIEEKNQRSGHIQYRAIAQAKVRLTLHWPGGRDTHHDGIGTSASVQKYYHEALDKNAQGSVTYALRDAAINLGAQFGLTIMRNREGDGHDRRPWQHYTSPNQPPWPVFSMVNAAGALGHTQVDYDAQGEEVSPAAPSDAHPAQPHQPQAPDAPTRDDLLNRTGEMWVALAQTSDGAQIRVLNQINERLGVNITPYNVTSPESAGGPSDAFLIALHDALKRALEASA
ncbi:MAG: RAD52 family DNA repair protein [Gammaproteobacteria bacterium]|nr:RAD52 family DNA repair protein [Gammaproteobacteria bacterium]